MNTGAPENKLATSDLKRVVARSIGTDVGRKRKENQDSYGFAESDKATLFVVADGMGGARGGSQASTIAVNMVTRLAFLEDGTVTRESIRLAIERAHRSILKVSKTTESLAGMGTTIVCLAVVEGDLFWAHVGDSRLYLVRDNRIVQLSKDHTLVQELVDSGALSPEQAVNHPIGHMLTRALGQNEELTVDVGDLGGVPRDDDIYILCCDGLTGHVDDENIRTTALDGDIESSASRLIAAANEGGGSDNITVLVAKIGRDVALEERSSTYGSNFKIELSRDLADVSQDVSNSEDADEELPVPEDELSEEVPESAGDSVDEQSAADDRLTTDSQPPYIAVQSSAEAQPSVDFQLVDVGRSGQGVVTDGSLASTGGDRADELPATSGITDSVVSSEAKGSTDERMPDFLLPSLDGSESRSAHQSEGGHNLAGSSDSSGAFYAVDQLGDSPAKEPARAGIGLGVGLVVLSIVATVALAFYQQVIIRERPLELVLDLGVDAKPSVSLPPSDNLKKTEPVRSTGLQSPKLTKSQLKENRESMGHSDGLPGALGEIGSVTSPLGNVGMSHIERQELESKSQLKDLLRGRIGDISSMMSFMELESAEQLENMRRTLSLDFHKIETQLAEVETKMQQTEERLKFWLNKREMLRFQDVMDIAREVANFSKEVVKVLESHQQTSYLYFQVVELWSQNPHDASLKQEMSELNNSLREQRTLIGSVLDSVIEQAIAEQRSELAEWGLVRDKLRREKRRVGHARSLALAYELDENDSRRSNYDVLQADKQKLANHLADLERDLPSDQEKEIKKEIFLRENNYL